MTLKCRKCGSEDVRREISFMANPNDTDKEVSEMIALSDWQWDDFEWCADCQDETILDEIEESA